MAHANERWSGTGQEESKGREEESVLPSIAHQSHKLSTHLFVLLESAATAAQEGMGSFVSALLLPVLMMLLE